MSDAVLEARVARLEEQMQAITARIMFNGMINANIFAKIVSSGPSPLEVVRQERMMFEASLAANFPDRSRAEALFEASSNFWDALEAQFSAPGPQSRLS